MFEQLWGQFIINFIKYCLYETKESQVAEEQGFEPWEDFHPRRFSRPVHSTTLPLLRQERNNRLK